MSSEINKLPLDPPEWITEDADVKAIYTSLSALLIKTGRVGKIHQMFLVSLCEHWERSRILTELIFDGGDTLKNPEKGTVYINPALNALSMREKKIQENLRLLGLGIDDLRDAGISFAQEKEKSKGLDGFV